MIVESYGMKACLHMNTYSLSVSFMGGGGGEEDKKKDSKLGKDETINVFSIASGHLYERFLRY